MDIIEATRSYEHWQAGHIEPILGDTLFMGTLQDTTFVVPLIFTAKLCPMYSDTQGAAVRVRW